MLYWKFSTWNLRLLSDYNSFLNHAFSLFLLFFGCFPTELTRGMVAKWWYVSYIGSITIFVSNWYRCITNFRTQCKYINPERKFSGNIQSVEKKNTAVPGAPEYFTGAWVSMKWLCFCFPFASSIFRSCFVSESKQDLTHASKLYYPNMVYAEVSQHSSLSIITYGLLLYPFWNNIAMRDEILTCYLSSYN